MKKALVITDLHLRPAYAELAMRILEKAEREVDINKPEFLLILGDTFHFKDRTFASMTNLFYQFLQRVTKKCKVIVLVGNHDWAVPYTVHSLSIYDMPNLTVVHHTYKLNDKIGFISYFREQAVFEEQMKSLEGCEILFGHLDINEFEVGSGWEEKDSFCGSDRFLAFKKVFTGHFHKAQEKTLANGTEIIYIGTGYTTDFGESDQEKRFLLIDLDTGEWSGIPTGLTLHRTIRIKAEDSLPVLPEDELARGVSYRVIIEATKEQKAAYLIPSDYSAKVDFALKNNSEVRLDISPTENNEVILKKYIDFELKRTFGDNASTLNSEKLFNLAQKYISKARS